ncbi:MAG: low molecular weight protein-tyrosine-phosphatase [Nitriliruptoraceae bacterium]
MTGPGKPPHILMVCLGNICRSPTAEVALREAALRRGYALTVSSAGTGDWHEGHGADERMRAAAAEHGLNLDGHIARQVDAAMLRDADLVLAMDRTNYNELSRIAHERHITTPIRLLRDFDPKLRDGRDVPDPYYGSGDGFTTVAGLCMRTAEHLLDVLSDLLVARDRQLEETE